MLSLYASHLFELLFAGKRWCSGDCFGSGRVDGAGRYQNAVDEGTTAKTKMKMTTTTWTTEEKDDDDEQNDEADYEDFHDDDDDDDEDDHHELFSL